MTQTCSTEQEKSGCGTCCAHHGMASMLGFLALAAVGVLAAFFLG